MNISSGETGTRDGWRRANRVLVDDGTPEGTALRHRATDQHTIRERRKQRVPRGDTFTFTRENSCARAFLITATDNVILIASKSNAERATIRLLTSPTLARTNSRPLFLSLFPFEIHFLAPPFRVSPNMRSAL